MRQLPRISIFFISVSIFFLCDVCAAGTVPFLPTETRDVLRSVEKSMDEEAIQKLITTLLQNTSNPTTIDYLKEIAKKEIGLTRQESLKLLRFAELVDYYNFLKSRISYLQENNNLQMEFIFTNGEFDESLMKATESIQAKIKSLATVIEGPGLASSEQNKREYLIDEAIDHLVDEKSRLLQTMEDLQIINNRLRMAKKKIIGTMRISKIKETSSQLTEQMNSIKNQLAEKNKQVQNQEKNLLSLTDKLKAVRLQFEVVKEKLNETDKRVAGLTKDLAGMSLQLYEKNKFLADKDARVTTMENELVDTQERLSLVQRIIQEKDQQIQILEEEMAYLQNRQEPGNTINTAEVANLRQDLVGLQEKLKTQADSGMAKMDSFEKQFENLNKKHNILEQELYKKNMAITQLNKKIIFKDGQLLNFKQISLAKDQKLTEMNGVVELYKARLNDTYTELKNQEERLNSIENKLETQLDNLLDQSGSPDDQGNKKSSAVESVDIWTQNEVLEDTKNRLDQFIENELNAP